MRSSSARREPEPTMTVEREPGSLGLKRVRSVSFATGTVGAFSEGLVAPSVGAVGADRGFSVASRGRGVGGVGTMDQAYAIPRAPPTSRHSAKIGSVSQGRQRVQRLRAAAWSAIRHGAARGARTRAPRRVLQRMRQGRVPPLMRTLLLLASVAIADASAESLDVDLRSGEHIYGTLVSIDADHLVLRRTLWAGRHGLITISAEIPRVGIIAMRPVASLEDDFRARAAACGDSYAARYGLARWCLDRGLMRHAADIALALAGEDRDDAVTADLLDGMGYIKVGRAWVEREVYAREHHLVEYGGTLMPPEEAAARLEHANATLLIRQTQERLVDLTAFSRTTLLELRDATISLRRAERHQRQDRETAEEARLKSMTPDQIADEKEVVAFDRAHDLAEPSVPDDKEVVDARKAATGAQARYDQAMSDRSVAEATLAKATAAAVEAAARVAALSGKPFPPTATAGPDAAASAPRAR